jgi:DNA repair exonuclease SbcCD nuclease subunit
MRFSFVHAADLHLDTPFEGIGEVSEALAGRLRDASLEALDRLVTLAIDRRAAFVLLAGDIYDGPERGLRAEFRLLHAARRLAREGIRLFAVHGNHDPLGGWSAVRQWPDNVTFFGSNEVTSLTVEAGGLALATIHGISYAERATQENLALKFRRTHAPGLHIGLLHANVDGTPGHDNYSPCRVDDLERAGMDYWALGHIHTRRFFKAGRAQAVYPGNTQGRSFKPAEQGAKGAVVVTCAGDSVLDIAFEPLDSVRFAAFTVDIGPLEDTGVLLDVLRAQAETAAAEAEGRELAVRAELCGRGELHEQLRHPGQIEGLLNELREYGSRLHPAIHWCDLADCTRSRIDREIVRNRGDFAAELVAHCDRLLASEAELAQFASVCWKHPKEAAIRRWLPEEEPHALRPLLLEAEQRALDGLLEPEGEAEA